MTVTYKQARQAAQTLTGCEDFVSALNDRTKPVVVEGFPVFTDRSTGHPVLVQASSLRPVPYGSCLGWDDFAQGVADLVAVESEAGSSNHEEAEVVAQLLLAKAGLVALLECHGDTLAASDLWRCALGA